MPSAHAYNLRSHQCTDVCLVKYSLGPNYKCMSDFMLTFLVAKMTNDTITNIPMFSYNHFIKINFNDLSLQLPLQ